MKKCNLFFLFIFFVCMNTSGADKAIECQWTASWITDPDAGTDTYGVYYFCKDFHLSDAPKHFEVYVSGDNRYKLYVNGVFLSAGPARSDVEHWNVEKIDLATHLVVGCNRISAVVWNDGKYRPVANISYRTGFMLQGASQKSELLNTDSCWKCMKDRGYAPLPVIFPNYYVAGPGEVVDMRQHPSDWYTRTYNIACWHHAVPICKAVCGGCAESANSEGWMLQSSPIPLRLYTPVRFVKARKSSVGIAKTEKLLNGKGSIAIPANVTTDIILDQTYLVNAYLTMNFSGGADARISIGYQEALFDKKMRKGDRNDIEGKMLVGRKDSLISDGRIGQHFTSLTWRTYRYVVIHVTTKAQPLVVNDIYGISSDYPFRLRASLKTSDQEIQKIFEVGWRTARLCANETYMDCPYYEQLQYFGDTRIQALITLYDTGDDRLVKNFLTQADDSRQRDGITLSRYPASDKQFITPYALSYVGALYDYMMYGGDMDFVRKKLMGVRYILDYFHQYQLQDGSLYQLPGWNFTDWVDSPSWSGGMARLGHDGCSALLDLQLLYAYEEASYLEKNLGLSAFAYIYDERIAQMKKTIIAKYWSDQRHLLADRVEKDNFSQHANTLAILTNLVPDDQARQIGDSLLLDTCLAKSSIYFRYFMHQALAKVGKGDGYLSWLDKWRENLKMGLTTWCETSDVDGTRSDCHAWGASPNIELFRILLGIDSDAPGFKQVKIEPHLGNIREIGGSMPHPNGMIFVSYSRHGDRLHAKIILPHDVNGRFIWREKVYSLHAGESILDVR